MGISTAAARSARLQAGWRAGLATFALIASLALASADARAVEIQTVETPGGLTAWLVEDHTVPIVAVNFAFAGGSAQDPDGKGGLANLMAATLDEGAGELESQAYRQRLEETAVKIGFNAGRDAFYGSLRTLTPNIDEAFELLRVAVNEPRFDAEAVGRMQRQIVSGLRRAQKDPDSIASRVMAETAYPDHPYGRTSDGTEETVTALTPEDLKALHGRLLAREELKISVVGAIDAERLATLLDATFADLPERADLTPVSDVTPQTGVRKAIDFDVPQTSIRLSLPGLKRDDPDFIPAYVMNHILGGGSFSSWLYEEVREKRGLAYSVGSYLVPYDHSGAFMAATGTRSDRAPETIAIIMAQMERMAKDGPSADELAKAKAFLTGSYALRFDTSDKIASQLLGIQMEELGLDYIDTRNAMIDAVTLEDIRRVARRLLANADPIVVTVGAGAS
ncbi:pitrilysin family protein [Stappia sp. ES.058]|uniref:M16 family metallopeptidase n=1 Tax=Stappia sp. ES.058 TaxID=1881061 RepID=UPI00087B318D|nr:pitrilysin family protein [Stappia sp. ES.058]SDT91427.1 zinc protease [Stappia sp. ES.058]